MDTIQRSTSSRAVVSLPVALLHARERRITVEEYHAMGEAGIFSEDDRIELIDGHLVTMPPIGPAHSHSVNDLADLFNQRLYSFDRPPARVSVQNPIHLGEYGEPQPDLVLYDPEVPRDRHIQPGDTFLVVEVAESSVEYDRDVKSELYGRAGIPEYWVVDLVRETVVGFRRPEGEGYAERIRYSRGDELTVTTPHDLEPLPVADVLGAQ
ncbi:Uma2 family endonuclease [Salinibacter ruber]|uniref:Uma2 family endonuclease n=1 Tax=Salinibacter ruber TaxID=146919 RepID=UPI002073302E|nr:Uma2 family endonuclease [Salinibacter ruber]MCS4116227.1 Uma2 family endonuclease [Salinibacter ruber]MCS4181738.1 Uma2 family endonuclease [Salinibacter ruber]